MEGKLAEKLAILSEELIPMRNAMIDNQEALENVLKPINKDLYSLKTTIVQWNIEMRWSNITSPKVSKPEF